MSERMSPEIRGQAYLDFVRYELTHAETWCRGVIAALKPPRWNMPQVHYPSVSR